MAEELSWNAMILLSPPLAAASFKVAFTIWNNVSG
jgi:hypothetical protein